jgi:hypothetical protein
MNLYQIVVELILSSPTIKTFTSCGTIGREGGDAQTIFAADGGITMITLTAQVPDSLYQQVARLAAQEQLSLDQLVSLALSAQVSAWTTQRQIAVRIKRGRWEKFQHILDKAPDVPPADEDQL